MLFSIRRQFHIRKIEFFYNQALKRKGCQKYEGDEINDPMEVYRYTMGEILIPKCEKSIIVSKSR